jgi:hypothetical protein
MSVPIRTQRIRAFYRSADAGELIGVAFERPDDSKLLSVNVFRGTVVQVHNLFPV